MFGIPPLVAKVYWPDLAQIDFFKPFVGKNPQDLVFVGLVFKLLPHGLIGVFIAAMLAATMTTLSTVYKMVSSVISHDIYKGIFRPDRDDRSLLKVGRAVVAEFFKKLDTPVDVATEVYGAGRKQVSTLPLVGRTIMFMDLLVSVAFLTDLSGTEMIAVGIMAGLLIFFGGMMWFLGKRGEKKEAEEIALMTGHS